MFNIPPCIIFFIIFLHLKKFAKKEKCFKKHFYCFFKHASSIYRLLVFIQGIFFFKERERKREKEKKKPSDIKIRLKQPMKHFYFPPPTTQSIFWTVYKQRNFLKKYLSTPNLGSLHPLDKPIHCLFLLFFIKRFCLQLLTKPLFSCLSMIIVGCKRVLKEGGS